MTYFTPVEVPRAPGVTLALEGVSCREVAEILKRPALDTPRPPARRSKLALLFCPIGLSFGPARLLNILKHELQLIGISGSLGAPAEQRSLQFVEDCPKLVVLAGEPGSARLVGQHQRLELPSGSVPSASPGDPPKTRCCPTTWRRCIAWA